MIAIDTNILIYAHRPAFPLHRQARRRLESLASEAVPFALPVFCAAEFVRVITHPKFDPPYSASEAGEALERIVRAPSLRMLYPTERFISLFLGAVAEAHAVGNLVFDAQIVAVCREHGVSELLTEDRDFARFRGFRTQRL